METETEVSLTRGLDGTTKIADTPTNSSADEEQTSREGLEKQPDVGATDTPSESLSPPKLDISFLSLDGQPIQNMMVQVRWETGELLAATNGEGKLPSVQAPAGSELSLAVQRFDGTYKAIGQCVMPSSEGTLTAVSPNMVCEIKTEVHEGAPGEAEQQIPTAEPSDWGDLAAEKEEGTSTADFKTKTPLGEPKKTALQPSNQTRHKTRKPSDKKDSPSTKQEASKPPQNIAGNQSQKPALTKGRDNSGNPMAVIVKKSIDWWNSWRMPTFNLWGGEESKGQGTAPTTQVTYNAEMKSRVENLLAFAKEQTGYLYTTGTADVLSQMVKGTFDHEAGEKPTYTSKGKCYLYVKIALTRCKIIDGILAAHKLSSQSNADHYAMQESASKAGPALLAKGFTNVTHSVPDARWAAAGDIIVYEWTPTTWNKRKQKTGDPSYPNHGHIDIRDYETYVSDFMPRAMHPGWTEYRNIRIYRKDFDPIPTLRIRAFLRCLRDFECQEERNDAKRYEMMNTALPNTNNRRFSGFSTHPWATVPDGLRPKSTAAGAYQILYGTWKEILDKGLIELSEGAASFTPDIQDRIAVMKLEDRSALHLIRSGKLDEAITQTDLKDEWSSLPGGRHNAGRRTAEGKPLDLAYLKSLFNTYLAEEKRKFGL